MIGVTQLARGAALAALTLLAGCGLFESDDMPPGQPFVYNGNTWQVSDDRGGQLDITAITPRLRGMGTIADREHPVATMPRAEYRAAAMGWFSTTGRFCSVDDGIENDFGGYRFTYSCWIPA